MGLGDYDNLSARSIIKDISTPFNLQVTIIQNFLLLFFKGAIIKDISTPFNLQVTIIQNFLLLFFKGA